MWLTWVQHARVASAWRGRFALVLVFLFVLVFGLALHAACGTSRTPIEVEIAAALANELNVAPTDIRCSQATCRVTLMNEALGVTLTDAGWMLDEPVIDPISLRGMVLAQAWELGLATTPACPLTLWRPLREPWRECDVAGYRVLVAMAPDDALEFEFVAPDDLSERLREPADLEAQSNALAVENNAPNESGVTEDDVTEDAATEGGVAREPTVEQPRTAPPP